MYKTKELTYSCWIVRNIVSRFSARMRQKVNTKVWRMFWLKRQHILKDVDKDGSVPVYQVKTSQSNDELTSLIDGYSTGMESKANEWFLSAEEA